MMQYCCDPKVCPCGPDRCGNPPLSKREGVPVAKDGLVVIWVSEPFLPFALAWRELSFADEALLTWAFWENRLGTGDSDSRQ